MWQCLVAALTSPGELCWIQCAFTDKLLGSSMESSLEQSLIGAGWAWSHELLAAVVADLRDVGIKDAPHMVGESAVRRGLHSGGAPVSVLSVRHKT